MIWFLGYLAWIALIGGVMLYVALKFDKEQ